MEAWFQTRARAARMLITALAVGLLGACATRSHRESMAPRCAGNAPILIMAEDPAQAVVRKGEPGFYLARMDGKPLSLYSWLWLTFLMETEVCLASPMEYVDAATKGRLEVGSLSAFGRQVAAVESGFDHVGFDAAHRNAILTAAAAAGTRFVVVGRWVGGASDRYRLTHMTVSQGSFAQTGSVSESTAAGATAQVEVQVYDAPSRELVFRKLYTGFEERQLGGATPPGQLIHASAVRRAIALGIIEDLTRHMLDPQKRAPTQAKMVSMALPAASPIVVAQGGRMEGVARLDVTLEEIERFDRFTRFGLRFQNTDRQRTARVTPTKNRLGLMALAKSTSGQVYRVEDDSPRQPESLTLRPGEAGAMSFVLRNDVGAMGTIALYVDVDVRIGNASGVRRVTFSSINAP